MENILRSDGNAPFQIEYEQIELASAAASLERTDSLDEPVVQAGEGEEKEPDEPFFGANIRKAIQIIRGS